MAAQRLHLDQQGPRPFQGDGNRAARCIGQPFGQKHLGWVGHLDHAPFAHLKDADLVGAAKTILHRTQQAIGVKTFPLQLQHHIDHMLQNLGAGNRAIFGDMADEKNRDVMLFTGAQQGGGAIAHLADGAGCAGTARRVDCLHRVNDHQRRLHRFDLLDNLLDFDLREHKQFVVLDPQSRGAPPDLMSALLGANIEHRANIARHIGSHLQQNCRFADPRFAADEDTATRHNPTAQHAVQLLNTQRQTLHTLFRNIGQRHRAHRPVAPHRRSRAAFFRRTHHEFLERVPLATVRALAHPLGL